MNILPQWARKSPIPPTIRNTGSTTRKAESTRISIRNTGPITGTAIRINR